MADAPGTQAGYTPSNDPRSTSMSTDNPYDTPYTSAADDHSSSTSASDRAQQAAGTASDEGKHVAGVARDEAHKVATEAQSQVSHLLNQATSQVEDQSRTQRDRLVETLRSVGEDLDKMASHGEGGIASDLAREGANRAQSLSSMLDGREPRDLLDDVRSFARRKPGTFLLGALAAGVVAGRLTRGAKDAGNGASGTSRGAGYGTAAGTPLAGTGLPASTPVYPEGAGTQPVPPTGPSDPTGSVTDEAAWSDSRISGGLA